MTPEQVAGFQTARANYRARARARGWTPRASTRSSSRASSRDIHLNDSIQPSFGRRDPQASSAGVPNVIFPAGVNDHGQPINLQLQGKAFDDLKLLGYRLRVRGQGQRARRAARIDAGAAVRDQHPGHGRRHGAGDALADARRAGDRSARSRRASRRTTRRTTTANVISTAGDAALSRERPGPPDQRLVRAARAAARSRSARRRWTAPVSNDPVTIAFTQHINADRPAAHGHLLQDADVHAVDDDAVESAGALAGPASHL